MNEEALIKEAARGSVDAFNQLVLLHQQSAYTVAYRMLGDEERATDATQEALSAATVHSTSSAGASSAPGCCAS